MEIKTCLFVSALSVTGGNNGAALGAGNVTLTCEEDNGTLADDGAYIWYHNSVVITTAINQTYVILPDDHNKAGDYKCKAGFTSTDVESANLTFNIYGRERSFQD